MRVAGATRETKSELYRQVTEVLARHTSKTIADVIVDKCCERTRVGPESLSRASFPHVFAEIKKRVRFYLPGSSAQQRCIDELQQLSKGDGNATDDALPASMDIEIAQEVDVVTARQTARYYCEKLGFSYTDQTKIATVVSELSRNIVMYAGKGTISISLISGTRSGIQIEARDHGSGIPNLQDVLQGDYKSTRGMGLGLSGSKRIMDDFDVRTGPGIGTSIRATKLLE